MQYTDPGTAQSMTGLRLALTAHMPAPYSMSARAVLDHHQVPYAAVEQVGAGANPDLVAWTRHRNAPVAVYNDEAPRIGWLEILNLAERLGSGASLIPQDIGTRMQMIAWINELIGENGLVWNLRILMLGLGGAERAEAEAQRNPMYRDYGYAEGTHTGAREKAEDILEQFTAHALAQPGHYLIGDRYSAIDIYWAYFSLLLKTLPDADCPMPKGLRLAYDRSSEIIGGCDAKLIACRDHTFANHLTLPMTF